MNRKKFGSRASALLWIFAGVFLIFVIMLTHIQTSADGTAANTAVTSYSVTAEAARGEILDTNGNAIVYNEQINTLVFNYLNFPKAQEERNEEILRLIRYLESRNEEWTDTLPLELDARGIPVFKENCDSDIRWLRSSSMLELNPYATAENCFDVLIEKFKLDRYKPADALKIASVCCNMQKNGFSAQLPYTFAEGISIATVAAVKENVLLYPGVDAGVTSKRKYIGDGTLAAHILGVVGAISAEEYAEQKEATDLLLAEDGLSEEERGLIKAQGYGYTDKIGKNGIEKAMEKYLHGTKGTKNITVDSDGNTTESYSVVPRSGDSVMLTIDQQMQEIADASLKKRILEVTDDEAIANGLTAAGAVVVLDAKDSAVLAAAAYPDFSLSTYYDDYDTLAADPGKPLWNRAFQSTYSPGSTMKPMIAIAALEEGLITPDTRLYCKGTYQYIDQLFACFNNTSHGSITVKGALKYSCNIFFYEMARQLGIDKMNTYSALFGLGEKTGIEIAESGGILAGIKSRDAQGLGWKAGETLLAAIGQSDNSFSPLQLANYCAAMANGGTRYVPYLVNKVISSDRRTTVFEHKPQIAVKTNISKLTLDTVKEGMYLVANEGSCKNDLGNLRYKVACKTGTAEKSKIIDGKIVNGTDGFLITFGPYDDARIAIAVVIENAGSGSVTARVAADIYQYYFSTLDKQDSVQDENVLIG